MHISNTFEKNKLHIQWIEFWCHRPECQIGGGGTENPRASSVGLSRFWILPYKNRTIKDK